MEHDKIAASLYGGDIQQSTPKVDATQPGPGSADKPIDAGGVFYGNNEAGIAHVLDEEMAQLAIERQLSPEQQQAERVRIVDLVSRLTPDITERRHLVESMTRASIKPADSATRAAWHKESVAFVNGRYGKDAPRLLAAVKEIIAREDGLRDHLNSTGLGDNPKIVEIMLSAAARGVKPKAKR